MGRGWQAGSSALLPDLHPLEHDAHNLLESPGGSGLVLGGTALRGTGNEGARNEKSVISFMRYDAEPL